MAETVSKITLAVHAIATDRTMDTAAVEAIKAGLNDGRVCEVEQVQEGRERIITIRIRTNADA